MPDTQKQRQQDFDRGLQREEHPLPEGQQGPAQETISSDHDRFQDRQEDAQNQTINEQGARVSALDGFIITPDEAAQNPDQQAASACQRLRIFVPEVKTTLSMGQRAPKGALRPDETGDPNYDGFGVFTLGHIFMNAAKDAASSTATIQAKGHVTLQSDESHVWLGAKESSVLHGGKHVMVNGGGGLFMSAGVMAATPTNPPSDGTVPVVPSWLAGIEPAALEAANFWGNVDMYAGAFEMAATAVQGGLDVYYEKGWGKLRALLWTAFQLTIGEIGAGVGDIATQGTLWPNKLDGSLIMHSKGSMVLGTQNSLGLFSTVGSTLGSATFAGITAPFASVSGVVSFEVQALGGSGSVSARSEVDVTGGKGLNLAARSGAASLLGEVINIGNAEGGGRQAATTDVKIMSKTKTILGSAAETVIQGPKVQVNAETTLDLGSPTTTIAGTTALNLNGKKITIIGNEGVEIGVGKTAIHMGASEVSLGFFSDKAETPIEALEGELKTIKAEIDDMEAKAPRSKGGSIRYSGKKVDGVRVPKFGKKKQQQFADLSNKSKQLAGKIAGLKSTKNYVTVGSSGIEIVHKGMSFKLDSSKVKSGSLEWKK